MQIKNMVMVLTLRCKETEDEAENEQHPGARVLSELHGCGR